MSKPTITQQQAAAARKLIAEGNTLDAIILRALRKSFDTEELKCLNDIDPSTLDKFLEDESLVEIIQTSVNWSKYKIVITSDNQIAVGILASDNETIADQSPNLTQQIIDAVKSHLSTTIAYKGWQSVTFNLPDGSSFIFKPKNNMQEV